MANLYNLARVVSATTGTGTLTLGAAVSGCLTFANAGVPNAAKVSYGISDGANSEVGWGTYASSGPTLSRDTVLTSTNGGNKISCSGNEQVFITVLSEDVAQADGWIPVRQAWAYASATTITVPAGAAAIYSVGDKIKINNTSVKYFYIVSVADTVLTVTGGTDYTVADSAISDIHYSHAQTPVNFPDYFNYTPSLVVDGGTAPTYTLHFINRFSMIGKTVHVVGYWENLSGGTAGAGVNPIEVSLPTTARSTAQYMATGGLGAIITAGLVIGNIFILSTTAFNLEKPGWEGITGNDQSTDNRCITFTFDYEVQS